MQKISIQPIFCVTLKDAGENDDWIKLGINDKIGIYDDMNTTVYSS